MVSAKKATSVFFVFQVQFPRWTLISKALVGMLMKPVWDVRWDELFVLCVSQDGTFLGGQRSYSHWKAWRSRTSEPWIEKWTRRALKADQCVCLPSADCANNNCPHVEKFKEDDHRFVVFDNLQPGTHYGVMLHTVAGPDTQASRTSVKLTFKTGADFLWFLWMEGVHWLVWFQFVSSATFSMQNVVNLKTELRKFVLCNSSDELQNLCYKFPIWKGRRLLGDDPGLTWASRQTLLWHCARAKWDVACAFLRKYFCLFQLLGPGQPPPATALLATLWFQLWSFLPSSLWFSLPSSFSSSCANVATGAALKIPRFLHWKLSMDPQETGEMCLQLAQLWKFMAKLQALASVNSLWK